MVSAIEATLGCVPPAATGLSHLTGHQFEARTGHWGAMHRYLDPRAGRWLSRDPIGFAGGLNLYAYVGNNPINRRDPRGLSPDDDLFRYYDNQTYGPVYGESRTPQDADIALGLVGAAALSATPLLLLEGGALATLYASAGQQVGGLVFRISPALYTLFLNQQFGHIGCGRVSDVGLVGRIGAAGMTTSQAGDFFGWENGYLTKTAADFTRNQLLANGWTQARILDIASAYAQIARMAPDNPSAAIRAEQMRAIAAQHFGPGH
jgi:RHS repeat-associated protein